MTFTLESVPGGVDLVLTSEWSPDVAAFFADGRADGLVLNYARGFRGDDLSFLENLPIRRLDVLARWIKDLSAVYSLADGLESLSVQSDAAAIIELERLPLLRRLSASWRQVHGSIRFASRLERLFLLSYTEPDFEPLAPLSALTSVVMKDRPRIRSLEGIQELPWLAELGVFLAHKLEDITALSRATSPVLDTLRLSSCRKVTDISPVAFCEALRWFEMSEGGELLSVRPLAELHRLELLQLYGSTKVLDGDLRPIAGLKNLRTFGMKERSTYSPSVAEIHDAISRRETSP